MDFRKELEEMRNNLENNRDRFKTPDMPKWLKEAPEDRLNFVFDFYDRLFASGRVYYAYIIQANILLFQPKNSDDCPASVIFSDAPEISENPFILRKWGQYIYSFTEKVPLDTPEELHEIVRILNDGRDRSAFSFKITEPGGLSAKADFRSVVVFRKHLPLGFLRGSVVPVLTADGCRGATIILPKSFWSKAFLKEWERGVF